MENFGTKASNNPKSVDALRDSKKAKLEEVFQKFASDENFVSASKVAIVLNDPKRALEISLRSRGTYGRAMHLAFTYMPEEIPKLKELMMQDYRAERLNWRLSQDGTADGTAEAINRLTSFTRESDLIMTRSIPKPEGSKLYVIVDRIFTYRKQPEAYKYHLDTFLRTVNENSLAISGNAQLREAAENITKGDKKHAKEIARQLNSMLESAVGAKSPTFMYAYQQLAHLNLLVDPKRAQNMFMRLANMPLKMDMSHYFDAAIVAVAIRGQSDKNERLMVAMQARKEELTGNLAELARKSEYAAHAFGESAQLYSIIGRKEKERQIREKAQQWELKNCESELRGTYTL